MFSARTMIRLQRALLVLLGLSLCVGTLRAEPVDQTPATDAAVHARTIERAVSFLRSAQDENGAYAAYAGPGVTSVVTTGLLRVGIAPNDPLVAKSLRFLEGHVQANGGIYQADTLYRNYETSMAVMVFCQANRNGRYDRTLAAAERFLKGLQWDEGEGHDPSSTSHGGSGYGKHQRPDMSNTQFMLDALKSLGRGPDDPAIKKALIFVSRCQNLETENNATEHASRNPDGGFYYTCAAGGSSQAGELDNGGLRSYGSMTYAGLKSMIYAGVGPDDPRVKAAFEWVQKNYDLSTNPGMNDAGLYYYYHTFAKTLDAMGLDEIETADGTKHDWRAELGSELIARQQADGSWVNENVRWLEGDAALVTGYVLMTLSYCEPKE